MNIRILSKRLVDVLGAGIALALLSPALAVVAVLIRWRMGTPVLFRQPRPGLRARPFTLYKFRTMRDARDERGVPLDDAARLTPLGRALRRTSLDELPQFWNVLRGDMSLVGPRPLLMDYLDRYSPEQMRRHDVKPGLTGLAQVSGRNSLDWEEKFALDVWYAEHWTLRLDARIILSTVAQVLRGNGVWDAHGETMPCFDGIPEERQRTAPSRLEPSRSQQEG
jgi:lipopolysaccharide/colanic/teichoic acid biosynthesis glycosyltransferase